MNSEANQVVFSKGEHVYTGENGTVTFCVPRDITFSELEPAVRQFANQALQDISSTESDAENNVA